MSRDFSKNYVYNLSDDDDLIYETPLNIERSNGNDHKCTTNHISVLSSSEDNNSYHLERDYDIIQISDSQSIEELYDGDDYQSIDSYSPPFYDSDSFQHFNYFNEYSEEEESSDYTSNSDYYSTENFIDDSMSESSSYESDDISYEYNGNLNGHYNNAYPDYYHDPTVYIFPPSTNPPNQRRNVSITINNSNNRNQRSQDDQDLVVLESVNRARLYPRVDSILIISVLQKLLYVYHSSNSSLSGIRFGQYPLSGISLSQKLRELTPEELKYLKDKVKWALSSLSADISRINFLIDLISPDKIDNLQNTQFISKNIFKVTKYKDLMNVQSKSCTICFENFKAMHSCITLKCCHTFHSACIRRWIDMSWCCPVCRSKDIHIS